jgi:hypothetical protein
MEKTEEEKINIMFSKQLELLFNGNHEIIITREEDDSLNLTEVLRLVVSTVRNCCNKIKTIEELYKLQLSKELWDKEKTE